MNNIVSRNQNNQPAIDKDNSQSFLNYLEKYCEHKIEIFKSSGVEWQREHEDTNLFYFCQHLSGNKNFFSINLQPEQHSGDSVINQQDKEDNIENDQGILLQNDDFADKDSLSLKNLANEINAAKRVLGLKDLSILELIDTDMMNGTSEDLTLNDLSIVPDPELEHSVTSGPEPPKSSSKRVEAQIYVEAQSDVIHANDSESLYENVPTPFKKALFWKTSPEEKHKATQKPKVKIPAVDVYKNKKSKKTKTGSGKEDFEICCSRLF